MQMIIHSAVRYISCGHHSVYFSFVCEAYCNVDCEILYISLVYSVYNTQILG